MERKINFKIIDRTILSIGEAYEHLYDGGIVVNEYRSAFKINTSTNEISSATPISIYSVRWYKSGLLDIDCIWFKGDFGDDIPNENSVYKYREDDTITSKLKIFDGNIEMLEIFGVNSRSTKFNIDSDLDGFWLTWVEVFNK